MREEPGSCKTPVDDLIIKAVAYLTPPLVTFLVFLPTLGFDFVNWDDNRYVYENPAIRSLGAGALKWAFTTIAFSSWYPLVLLSFSFDFTLWGLNPMGYHLTNTILHSLNAFLVAIVVTRLASLSGRDAKTDSATVAGNVDKMALVTGTVTALFFALHPMRVESVAWITERKDVLYAFFYLLAILAYLRYAVIKEPRKGEEAQSGQRSCRTFYAASLLFFTFSLMSKSMAITLPLTLLILDYYPLKRPFDVKTTLIEKAPFFLLSALITALAIWTHQAKDSLVPFSTHPLSERALVSIKGYAFYLYKTVIPLKLAPFYPLPEEAGFFTLVSICAAMLLIFITALSVAALTKDRARSKTKGRVKNNLKGRLFITAWLYYLVTLLPVIGIMQTADRAAADRYSYLACLGPFILAGALVAKLTALPSKRLRALAATAALLITAAFIVLTLRLSPIWENSFTLWTRQIELYPAKEGWSHPGYLNRANALMEAGRFSEALPDFDMAARVDPADPGVYNGRAKARAALGQVRSAVDDYGTAIALDPGNIEAYLNRAVVFTFLRDYERAARDYETALKLTPGNKDTSRRLAEAYMRLGREDLAREVIMRGKRAR